MNEKIAVLAEILVEGTTEMASYMLKTGGGQSAYEGWAIKLNDVYMEEAQKITDAYMASVGL